MGLGAPSSWAACGDSGLWGAEPVPLYSLLRAPRRFGQTVKVEGHGFRHWRKRDGCKYMGFYDRTFWVCVQTCFPLPRRSVRDPVL